MVEGETALAIDVPDEAAMCKLGQQIAKALVRSGGCMIHLQGELGSGKTTIVRSILRALGITGHIKSPTYTLVEPYETEYCKVYHLDLYRLADPEELEYLGLRDFLTANSLLFVEWPERGKGILPLADVRIEIHYAGTGRKVIIEPGEGESHQWLQSLTV